MKIMERNKKNFWYCLYKGKTAIKDDYGNETGEYTIEYDDPVQVSGNVSAATGSAQTEQFGNLVGYDKVIVIDDITCPVDENTVLFVDKEPEFENDVPLYDYIVKRVAKSLNSVSYAISKVSVS